MTDQEKTTIKQELETEFPRGTGLETRPRTKAEVEETLSKKIYSFWIDGEMWRNYLTNEECKAYLAMAPHGEQRPVVR